MDEPLSALDKKLREEIQYEIRRIHQETGVTILYVTHDQEEALRLSDKIAVFNQGRIEQVGTGPTLYTDPATRFVAAFIGDSAFLRGILATQENGRAALIFPDGTVLRGLPLHGSGSIGSSAELMLRPERVRIFAKPQDEGASLPVVVTDMTFLGNTIAATVKTAWGEMLQVRLEHGNPMLTGMEKGDTRYVAWAPDAAHVFMA